jgi:pilus assembly protein FimV
MAYGRDAQAEEILKDAITKEPKRYELHLKLLEMYAASKNMSAFETVSGELYTTLGADDPTWAKVAEIGSKLEPNNPLYQVSSSLTGAVPEDKVKLEASDFSDSPLANEKDLDLSFGGNTIQNIPSIGVEEVALESDTGESGDFDDGFTHSDLELESDSTKAESIADFPKFETEKVDAGLDFSMGDLNAVADESKIAESAGFSHTMPDLDFPKFETDEMTSFTSDSSFSPDFPSDPKVENELSLDISEPPSDHFGFDITTIAADSPYKEEAKPLDLSNISLDLGDESTTKEVPNSDSTVEEPVEVETKLELVAAYIEMDDKEGAKELLEEVIKEGGASQRKRAEELLTKIV